MMGEAGWRSAYLDVVVVELAAGDDLAYYGGLGGVVAEDGDFEFAGFGVRGRLRPAR